MPEMAFLVRSWLTSAGFTPGFFGSSSARIMRPGVVSRTSTTALPLSSVVWKRPLHLGVQGDGAGFERVTRLGDRAEQHALARLVVADDRQVVEAEHDVLRRHDDRRAVGRMQDVVGRHHQHARFQLRFERQRDVHGHLVAVEVGVERRADERMQLDRLALDQGRLEGLDAEAVQRRRAVQQHRMLADHLIEDVPNLRPSPFRPASWPASRSRPAPAPAAARR